MVAAAESDMLPKKKRNPSVVHISSRGVAKEEGELLILGIEERCSEKDYLNEHSPSFALTGREHILVSTALPHCKDHDDVNVLCPLWQRLVEWESARPTPPACLAALVSSIKNRCSKCIPPSQSYKSSPVKRSILYAKGCCHPTVVPCGSVAMLVKDCGTVFHKYS